MKITKGLLSSKIFSDYTKNRNKLCSEFIKILASVLLYTQLFSSTMVSSLHKMPCFNPNPGLYLLKTHKPLKHNVFQNRPINRFFFKTMYC